MSTHADAPSNGSNGHAAADGTFRPRADATVGSDVLIEPDASTRRGVWQRLAASVVGQSGDDFDSGDEAPLRGDLYSGEQLARHARTLAGWHEIDDEPFGPQSLLDRLADNRRVLDDAYDRVVRAAEKGRRITPAAEWLVDNYYLIERQLRLAQRHLPRRYAIELPRLRTGPNAGRPRVYDIALELITHVDGQVDAAALNDFVNSYQQIDPLRLGELWAVPIMLRFGLIENLRRVAARVAAQQRDHDLAAAWAKRMLDAAKKDPKGVVRVLSSMHEALEAGPQSEHAALQLTSAFVSEFARRLQGQGPSLAFPLQWLGQALSEQGADVTQMEQIESQRQAADQVSIGNSIGSLRFVESHDWADWVEDCSVVELALRADPAGVYAKQDFKTRDRYRHSVERIARRSPYGERQVAELAVNLARNVPTHDDERVARERHVGHYLVGKGRPALEKAAGARSTFRSRLSRMWQAMPLTWFIGGVTVPAILVTGLILWYSRATGMPWWAIALLIVPVFIAATGPFVGLVNWIVTKLATPKPLARLEYDDGIPSTSRTAVVVPGMITSYEGADALAAEMEVRYLGNGDENLVFALLTDFADADEEQVDGDDDLLDHAAMRVNRLNERYGFGEGEKFMLLHRPRRWNEGENSWMGWERKRGKLEEFNKLLTPQPRDGDPAARAFMKMVAQRDKLLGIEYVIVLDSDTQLPRDTARDLVAVMDHPLNRAKFDPSLGRVTDGYGILQPRVEVSLPDARASYFARLTSGEVGVDPYTNAISDVYQDAFGEGSFIGKGIYHVATFDRACDGRFPENAILSHDLIESAFVRSGLATDVVFYEDTPTSYPADVARRTRWVRGDWQLLRYVLPSQGGISGLSRWKLIDNLRRSLVPIMVVVALLVAAVAKPEGFWAWALLAVGYFMVPPLVQWLASMVSELTTKEAEESLSNRLRAVRRGAMPGLARGLMSLMLLPYEAYIHLKAIVKTLWRMRVTRKHLLEWRTAAEAERSSRRDHQSFWESMWPTWGIGLGLAGFLFGVAAETSALTTLALLTIPWAASPTVAFLVSRPSRRKAIKPASRSDVRFLRKIARRTWSFFDRYVAAADHYLPPDNVQEVPDERVAPRTSPTNIGLLLLSNLSARDFGYITLGQVLDRSGRTLDTCRRLERHESGHFYNWYDTRRLEPLTPRYVSAVDSGNFIASLGVFERGLLGLIDEPAIPRQSWPGMADSIRVLLDTCRGREIVRLPGNEAEGAPEPQKFALPSNLEQRLQQIADDLAGRDDQVGGPSKMSGVKLLLQKLSIAASEAVDATRNAPEEHRRWAHEVERQAARFAEELHHLCPWVDLVGPSRPYHPSDLASQERLRLIDETLLKLESYPTLRQVADIRHTAVPAAEALRREVDTATLRPHADLPYFERLSRILRDAAERAQSRIDSLERLADIAADLAKAEWTELYDRGRRLLHIGYDCRERRPDPGHYDLLASEMRLGSFALVAAGVLPEEHWFALGRSITQAGPHPTLLSWSGSMFEYLMPRLVMPDFEGTLLDEACRGAVERQIEYARTNGIRPGVPWGVSESGYAAVDAELTYQYRPFGVPGLGFKRGLGEDLVIAPYASMMASMINPSAAATNLRRLRDEGKMGRFGFFEAVDYTPSRIKRDRTESIVRQFMAHHQAMGFLAVADVLLDGKQRERMMRDPANKGAELLLHERVPHSAPVFPHAGEHAGSRRTAQEDVGSLRIFRRPDTPTPEVHLLGNGRLATMVTAAGGGYTLWEAGDGNTISVSRWREDATRDHYGTFVYLRDTETGDFWSNTYHPTLRPADKYEAIFSQARAEYRRVDVSRDDTASRGEIETYTQVSVSPEDDVEVRRVTLTNHGRRTRTIEVTSYLEPVLVDPRADAAHPAFQNLFVQTRLVRGRSAILAKRRARDSDERTPYAVHLMTCHGNEVHQTQYETDRGAFLGRGRDMADPIAMHRDQLGDTSGSVLDPVMSIRRTVRLKPGEKCRLDVVTGVADHREAAHGLIEKYHDRRLCDRVADLAWTHSQVVLRQLGIDEADAQAFGRLAGSMIYATPQRRAPADVIARNADLNRKQSNLWSYGISGDLPVILCRVDDRERVRIVDDAVHAHAYWRRKGLKCDLVIWNEDQSGYRAEVAEAIDGAIDRSGSRDLVDRPGGIFVRRGEQFPDEDKVLIQAVARVTLSDKAGRLQEQIDRRMTVEPLGVPKFVPQSPRNTTPSRRDIHAGIELRPRDDLLFNNGTGGFTPDGKEYVITHDQAAPTPAPWSNVIANPKLGMLVSEGGVGYTWRTNAREFRLTPFYNDPVGDTSGEALYIRDEESGDVWSPTGLPARGTNHVTTRHGFGYSVFESTERDVATETTLFVHPDEPVKFVNVRLNNLTDRRRRISLWYFAEWCLTDQRASGAMHVVTGVDPKSGAILARNPYNPEFGRETAFLQCSEATRTVSGDRLEFLGRNGRPSNPAAMRRDRLSNKVGAGLDPCGAMCVPVDLGPGEEKEIVFSLGAGDDEAHAKAMAGRFLHVAEARTALEQVWNQWGRTLGTLYIETPDPAVNVLANGWLEYQALACRYWGRSGYYQSGGAYGFRDQLQDVAALLWCEPTLIREHLLRAAAKQFKEGDVLHWWHPPGGKGVRTHFSDDYMWLPLIAARYVHATGDTGVLDEVVSFLEGPHVPPTQESIYQDWPTSGEAGDLYEHAKRAILNGIDRRGYGQHGLPLMGCGDWNDGMNLVGDAGRGESVWLAWFFIETLHEFAPVAEGRGDHDFAMRCHEEANKLRDAVEREAWDGQWYRRAYFDNGEPLGSQQNPECQIDSLPQSWSVLSGAGDPERSASGMRAVEDRLVRREKGLIQLFDPPFDDSDLEPGYIKGYVPGVRENGGQYTHAAVWTVMAYAKMGDARRAWELFDLINPVNHADDPEGVATYRVEPYVAAADVYGVEPHVGRGGWTWYTGSAGWMFRLMVESLLGLTIRFEEGEHRLYLAPLLPEGWDGFAFSYRHRETHHRVEVKAGEPGERSIREITIDGKAVKTDYVRLLEDGKSHEIVVTLGG